MCLVLLPVSSTELKQQQRLVAVKESRVTISSSSEPDHIKRQGYSPYVSSVLGRYSLVHLLLILVIGFSLARPASFFTINNFQGIFINQVVVVFAAIGLIAPLIVGELDLSVGYVVGLSQALVVGLMTLQGLSPPLAIVITIIACALVGIVNGALV